MSTKHSLLIKDDDETCAQLEAALRGVQGTSRASILTALDLILLAQYAEIWLASAGLPKTQRQGASCRILPPGPNSKRYGYPRNGTAVVLARTAAGWRVELLERVTTWPGDVERKVYQFNSRQKNYLLKALCRVVSFDSEQLLDHSKQVAGLL